MEYYAGFETECFYFRPNIEPTVLRKIDGNVLLIP